MLSMKANPSKEMDLGEKLYMSIERVRPWSLAVHATNDRTIIHRPQTKALSHVHKAQAGRSLIP